MKKRYWVLLGLVAVGGYLYWKIKQDLFDF
jgi:hypothetical protein